MKRQRFKRRRFLIDAAEVRNLRARLELSQREFAEELGVSHRTIVRAEQRGLEVPLDHRSPRAHVRHAWVRLASASLVRGLRLR